MVRVILEIGPAPCLRIALKNDVTIRKLEFGILCSFFNHPLVELGEVDLSRRIEGLHCHVNCELTSQAARRATSTLFIAQLLYPAGQKRSPQSCPCVLSETHNLWMIHGLVSRRERLHPRETFCRPLASPARANF